MPLLLAPHIGRLSETQDLSMAILAFFTMVPFIAFYLIYFLLYKERSEIQRELFKQKIKFKIQVV
ncbi:hypothetical protein [Psychroflexus sp. MES1-P1E]|uniref:hypothetical protein n=1 Tax=Psychroflexus sp. MES1-P1E TaxID=2058320 RepID=UPI000C7E1D11|nr:hypothetical protein [Psychroflexus sp. MES1-P1E]PKG44106.1 hypothetical protein CXF67_01455 [Psychroflexus sp. MES1-P1E]